MDAVWTLCVEGRVERLDRCVVAVIEKGTLGVFGAVVDDVAMDQCPPGRGMHVLGGQHRQRQNCGDRADRHADSGRPDF